MYVRLLVDTDQAAPGKGLRIRVSSHQEELGLRGKPTP